MTKTIKIFILLGFLSFISTRGVSQLSISYYSSSLSKIGMGYQFSDRIWSEFRVYSNTIIEDFTPELVVCYNISKKDYHNVYVGLGGNVNVFEGIVLPIGVQFSPFEKLNRFSLHIELQPSWNIGYDFILQSSWGLRYRFGPNKSE